MPVYKSIGVVITYRMLLKFLTFFDLFRASRISGWLWSGLLLALLAFLVLYPTFMLLYGALSGTNPVVDGFSLSAVSLDNFIEVLANPNVHFALINTLLVCSGGTAIAVVIGLGFAWIVVRTNT